MLLCELCESGSIHNFHHLIPQTLHSNKWFKKRYTRQEMAQGLKICKECHDFIHDAEPNEKKLGRLFNTKEKLLSHPKISAYVKWKKGKTNV